MLLETVTTFPILLGTRSLASCNGFTLSSVFTSKGQALVRPIGLRPQQTLFHQRLGFATSRCNAFKEFFPAPDSPQIRVTKAAWQHPIYTDEQMNNIEVAHREAKTWSDRAALMMVRTLRWGLDLALGYKHASPSNMIDGKPRAVMNERKFLIRNVFLESVAGVPGMVGGMLRHLHSMRRMRRDNGWIETLLEESYNERMHLLIFMKMAEPGWFMRLAVLATQGIFFNGMFLAYLASPRIAHRFVGYLEEEAVLTYTREIAEIDAGNLPMWADPKFQAPDIAVSYYQMPVGRRTMRDLLLYIRADEAKHREVNSTLANLNQKEDPNPFVSEYKDKSKPHPTKGLEHLRSTGWEREEVI